MIKEALKKRYSRFKQKLAIYFFKGEKYFCPFCGFRSTNLKWFGNNYPVITEKQIIGSGLRRSRCYRCNSSDRERLIYAFLENEVKFFESNNDSKILHISPERHLTDYIRTKEYKEYIGGDLFTEGYEYPDFVQDMDITKIPFPENYFDLIVCNHVLEHIPDDHQAMKELFRVLKPKGLAFLQVPISLVQENTYEDMAITEPDKRAQFFGQYDHVRIYGQDYADRLSKAGFIVRKYDLASKYFKLGLNPKEILFTGTKNE